MYIVQETYCLFFFFFLTNAAERLIQEEIEDLSIPTINKKEA